MNFLRQFWTVARKDIRSELRSREAINGALSFSLVILLLLSFAFDPTAEQVREIAGGLIWLVFAFAGAMILNRSFARELPNDCLDALLVAPISPSALFLGKAFASFLLLLAIELVALPFFSIFYNISWQGSLVEFALVLLLGSWGFTVIGTMFSALTVNLRLREIMLPMLLYPMMIPALLAAIQLSAHIISGEPLADGGAAWKLLIGFDVIFTALSLVLVDSVLVG